MCLGPPGVSKTYFGLLKTGPTVHSGPLQGGIAHRAGRHQSQPKVPRHVDEARFSIDSENPRVGTRSSSRELRIRVPDFFQFSL